MHTFKDKEENEWTLDLTLAFFMGLNNVNMGPALRDPNERYISFFPPEAEAEQAYHNHLVCFEIVWQAVKHQLAGKEYTDQESGEKKPIKNINEFACCFDGRAVELSRKMLYEEVINFFPQMGTTLRVLSERAERAVVLGEEVMSEALMVSLSDQKIRDAMVKAVREVTEDL